MAHCKKFTRAATSEMLRHYDRTNPNISNVKHPEKSCKNYNLAKSDQPLPAREFLTQRLSQVKVLNRADVKIMCDWVVTAPKDLPESEHKAFFRACYDCLARRYGRDNVISAWVHMDETTPHIHFAFVPVKDGRVSAKAVISRAELRQLHPALQKSVEGALGHSVSILNGATAGHNLTVTELKLKTAQQQLSATRIQAQQAEEDMIINTQAARALERQVIKATQTRDDAQQAAKAAQDALESAKAQAAVISHQAEQTALQAAQRAKTAKKQAQDAERRAADADNQTWQAQCELVQIASDIERLRPLRDALAALDEQDTITTDQYVVDYLSRITYEDGSTVWDGLVDALDERDARRRAVQQYEVGLE